MIEMSEPKFVFLTSFATFGIVCTLLLISYLTIMFIKYLIVKVRKRCYQCGDDFEKTKKYKTGYYCSSCIESGLAKENEDYKENQIINNNKSISNN